MIVSGAAEWRRPSRITVAERLALRGMVMSLGGEIATPIEAAGTGDRPATKIGHDLHKRSALYVVAYS